VSLSLFYDHANGFMSADVNTNLEYSGFSPGLGVVFSQARIGTEPAFEAEIATYNNKGSCFISWWAHHQVKMTSNGTSARAVQARPRGLSNLGCDFSVYLEP
jgi:hypothetical protein